ncbi:Targeting complex [Globisporangium polare]
MNAWTAPRPTAAQTSRWTRNSEFLVYLVPVGAISQERYAGYVALLQQHCVLPISALTRPGGYAAELSPFKSFSWQSAGAISFRFVSTAERVESCDGEDVHAWNRPIGVIGICHCPSTSSLKDAYAQFAVSIKHFPGTLVQKCFAFEHQFDEGTVEQVAALSNNLVMFPVHHELDAGCSTVSLHLQVVLDTIAVTILMSLESTIRAAMRQQAQNHHHSLPSFQSSASSPLEFGDMASFLLDTNVEPMHANQASNANSSAPLLSTTPSQSQSLHATISSMASTAVSTTASAFTSPFSDSGRGRKRQIARHRKLFGDYSVLLDCVPDALEHYATALELLKDEERKSNGASGDTLWLAAALEGYVYCLFLESKDQFVVEIVEKASEAIALYAKAGVSDLECQLIEKIGWYCVAVESQLMQEGSKAKGKEKVNEAIWIKRLLWDTLDRGLAVFPELHIQRQIEFVIEASRMLESVGHRRRMAFFLHEAVALLISRNNTRPVSSVVSPSLQNSTVQRQRDLQAALLLERMTAARLGITDTLSSTQAGNQSREWEVTTLYRSKKTRRGVQIDPAPMASHEHVWLVLRLHVLRQLLTISKMLGDPYLVGKYCIQLLQMLPWCDSIASHTLVTASKRTPAMANNNRKLQTGRTTGVRTPPVEQVQQPFSLQRSPAQSAERQGLFAKSSVYFTPPSSVETKAKRYFTLAGSPSATMSSAAASLSSTIASTPRVLLATPRQQFSAAVNAISTKASPAFASLSHHSHASPHSTYSNSSSSSPSVSGMGGSGEIGLSPNPGTAGSSENDFERPQATSNDGNSSSTPNGSSSRTNIQDRMFEALPVWNIRSKEEVVKMEKSILTLMEIECSSLRPSEQVKLPTFLGVEKICVLARLDHPFFPKSKALELYAPKTISSATGDQQNASAKSDFFYSPFEKQQQEKHRAAGTQDSSSSDSLQMESSVFPVYEKIELEMTVSNPFGVALGIQQATAWVVYTEENNQHYESTTAAVECYPCSFELAPYETQKSVILGIQPLRTGSFCVRGCFLKALNLKTSFALAAPVELRVVGKLPLASLSLCEFGSLAHDNPTNRSANALSRERREDLRISMFSSETKQCELRIRNVGPNAISKCHLRATVLRKQVVRKAMVVFDNLTASSVAAEDCLHEHVIETDSLTLRCRLRATGGAGGASRGDAVSVPMANGDVVSIQFEILLLHKSASRQHQRFAGEDEPLEEEEEIVWSFVYADDPNDGEEGETSSESEGEVFYRETKLALKLMSLPSLKLSSVSLLPSTPEWIPASGPLLRGYFETEEQMEGISSAVMDNSHFLLVVEVENPTETAFRFKMRRRTKQKTERVLIEDDGADETEDFGSSCDVEIGRKCSRRLAIEVPRISLDSEDIGGGDVTTTAAAAGVHRKLASLLNALVEMQWETYFGTSGKLLFDDSLWSQTLHSDQVEAAKRELVLPEFALEISVPGLLPSYQELSKDENEITGGEGIPMLDGDENKTSLARSPFVFFQSSQLNRERRELAVRVLEFVPIVFAIRNLQQKTGRSAQVSIEIRISEEGEDSEQESSLVDESVVVVGMLSRDVEWANDDNEEESAKTHEIQALFLSRGDFRISICGRILDEETNRVREIWCHQPLYICASE